MNNIVEVSRCTGHCCRKFTLSFSLKELDSIIESFKSEAPRTFTNDRGNTCTHHFEEKEVLNVRDMLIFLEDTPFDPKDGHKFFGENKQEDYTRVVEGTHPTYPQQKLFDQGLFIKDGQIVTHTYTCKHFNTTTGNCENYENRPKMCRNFGTSFSDRLYGCGYTGCTMSCKSNNDIELDKAKEYDNGTFTK